MKKHNYFVLPCMALVLSSCGLSLDRTYENYQYNSSKWDNNYYREHEDCFIDASERRTIELQQSDIFLTFESPTFRTIDPVGSSLDKYSEAGEESYPYNYKLSNYDDSFKNDYVSKLFDGKMYCFGRYETVRVQIDQDGFNTKFAKTMVESDYLALNFKSDLDFKSGITSPSHAVSLDLNIRFYYEENNGYVFDTFTYRFDNNLTTNGDVYYFFGFSLKDFNVNNIVGIGIDYSNFVDYDNPNNLAHALLLYELFLPNSSWN